MTLLEALQDIGKGRIIDNGCNYELVALAKGTYKIKNHWHGLETEITLDGKPGENAAAIEKAYYNFLSKNPVLTYDGVSVEYIPPKRKRR